MRGFIKISLAFGGVFLAAGIGLCISGILLGYEPGSILGASKEKLETMRDESYELSYAWEYEDITSLKVEVGAAECQILAYDGQKIRVEADNTKYLDCKKNGENLKVSYGQENFALHWFDQGGVGFIRIYIPKGEVLETLEVDGGAASITMEELVCKDVNLEIGAGALSYTGSVEKKISVDCGAGSVELILEGQAEDFNYSLECGLGSVSVENGPGIAGIGESKVDNRAAKKAELECGLGSIAVTFR